MRRVPLAIVSLMLACGGHSAQPTAATSYAKPRPTAQPAPAPAAEEPSGVVLAYDPGELRGRANLASTAVSELARERDWQHGSRRAARALDAFAGALEATPLAASPETWRSLVMAVRFEAVEIRREGEITIERADRVKAGLSAAITALEHIARERRTEPFATLVTNARRAVDAIDAGRTWIFQRAILQEAFRTTADAFLVLANTAAEAPPLSARR